MSHHENWPPARVTPADSEQPSGGAVFYLAIVLGAALVFLSGVVFRAVHS